jgi:hypothetical protein
MAVVEKARTGARPCGSIEKCVLCVMCVMVQGAPVRLGRINRLNMLARRHWPALGVLPPRLTRGAARKHRRLAPKGRRGLFRGRKRADTSRRPQSATQGACGSPQTRLAIGGGPGCLNLGSPRKLRLPYLGSGLAQARDLGRRDARDGSGV